MMNRTALTLAVALAFSPLAFVTANAEVTSSDRSYLEDDAQGAGYELALAQMAQQESKNPVVKAYADKLVADHAVYNQALEQLAQAKGVKLPKDMTLGDTARLTSLRKAGYSDEAFVKEAQRINTEDKETSAKEMSRTTDADIKAFLQKFQAVDAEHERMAAALRS